MANGVDGYDSQGPGVKVIDFGCMDVDRSIASMRVNGVICLKYICIKDLVSDV